MNKLTEQNPKVGLTIKWQMSKWKTTDRIETHHSNLESSRTIVFWCYWLTTNNIWRLCWQIRARVWQYTIHFDDQSLSSIFLFTTTLSCSSTDDYDQHDSCIGVKRLLTIYNKNVNKSIGPCQGIRVLEPVKFLFVESGILSFGMRNKAQRIRNATKDWNPIQRSTRKKWN